MQKVVIAAFVLLGCVCLIQATTTMSPSSSPTSVTSPPGASVSTQEPTSKPNTTESTEGTTATTTSEIKATTSGVGTVKGFAGLVMSIFVIALM